MRYFFRAPEPLRSIIRTPGASLVFATPCALVSRPGAPRQSSRKHIERKRIIDSKFFSRGTSLLPLKRMGGVALAVGIKIAGHANEAHLRYLRVHNEMHHTQSAAPEKRNTRAEKLLMVHSRALSAATPLDPHSIKLFSSGRDKEKKTRSRQKSAPDALKAENRRGEEKWKTAIIVDIINGPPFFSLNPPDFLIRRLQ